MIIDEYNFELTCGACPEQYDVFDEDGNQVAYVRLRWGHLRVDVPDCGGELLYEHNFPDSFKGMFMNEHERRYYLQRIAKKLKDKKLNEKNLDKS